MAKGLPAFRQDPIQTVGLRRSHSGPDRNGLARLHHQSSRDQGICLEQRRHNLSFHAGRSLLDIARYLAESLEQESETEFYPGAASLADPVKSCHDGSNFVRPRLPILASPMRKH